MENKQIVISVNAEMYEQVQLLAQLSKRDVEEFAFDVLNVLCSQFTAPLVNLPKTQTVADHDCK